MLNQKGMAVLEVVPVLVIFLVMINFTLGFFGIIHSGILNSIAARNYAFETFRNRADLNYIRDTKVEIGMEKAYFNKVNFRYHGVITEGAPAANGSSQFYATERPLRFTDLKTGIEEPKNDPNTHNRSIAQIDDKKTVQLEVSPVWVKTIYGICLNSDCKKTN